MEEQQKLSIDSQKVSVMEEDKRLQVESAHHRQHRNEYPTCEVSRWPIGGRTLPPRQKEGQPLECLAQHSKDSDEETQLCPHLASLHIEPKQERTSLPLEVCNPVAGPTWLNWWLDTESSAVLELSTYLVPGRRADARRLPCFARLTTDLLACESGTAQDSLTAVTGTGLLPPSALRVRQNKAAVPPARGVMYAWNRMFYLGLEVKTWAIACFAPQTQCSEDQLKAFIRQLRKISREARMPIQGLPCFCKYVRGVDKVEPLFRHLKTTHANLQLLLIVMPHKTQIYSEIRRMGVTMPWLATQCVKIRSVQRATPQALSHVCVKINARLAQVTNSLMPLERPSVFQQPVIFLGADVTHSPARHGWKPSVAALVGSLNLHLDRYCTLMRIQQHQQETVQDLEVMVRTLLLKFYKFTGFKPTCIFFYRLGASEDQFQQVLSQELLAIRRACAHLEKHYQPSVTYIALRKHRHARSSSRREQAGATGGTEVPTLLSELDFYLCGHADVQGSSELFHYRVLWDDSSLSTAQLQAITRHLCHTYLGCARLVAIPAPVYYAHLVALRVRYYLLEEGHTDNEDSQTAWLEHFQSH